MGLTKLRGAELRLERAEYNRDGWVRHILTRFSDPTITDDTRQFWKTQIAISNINIDMIQEEILLLTPEKEIPIPNIGIWNGKHYNTPTP